jgi:hypothetical protein
MTPTSALVCAVHAKDGHDRSSKLVMRVGFPSSSPGHRHFSLLISTDCAALRAFRARSRLDAHHQPAVHRNDV